MKIAVLGTGPVGQTLASTLVECEHDVWIGSRTAHNDAGAQWATRTGGRCAEFAVAAANAEIVVNATAGVASVAIFESISEHVAGKVVIDVANALDFSNGFPPHLSVCNTSSLAEEIQRVAPGAAVIKTLNTVNAELMVAPQQLGSEHVIFVAGNDNTAKLTTIAILREFGWQDQQIIDLGDITGARAMEMYLPLWLRLFQSFGSAQFNISLARPTS